MNDERFLKDWLQDTNDSTADPKAVADKVVARAAETPQRRRWLPWPPTRHQRDDDRTPNGRTRFMLSPGKTFAALALALALGGTYLVALAPDTPSGDTGSAEFADFVPVEFTGVFSPGPGLREGEMTTVDGRVTERGTAWTPTIVEISDDRLDGRLIYAHDVDRYAESGLRLFTVTYRIENADGAWQGSTLEVSDVMDDLVMDDLVGSVVLVGEGEYDGLYAGMEQTDGNVRGYILPGPPPPASELPPLPEG